jgi:hypothetical protein
MYPSLVAWQDMSQPDEANLCFTAVYEMNTTAGSISVGHKDPAAPPAATNSPQCHSQAQPSDPMHCLDTGV